MSDLKKIRVQHVDRDAKGVEIKTDVDVITDVDCITMDDGDLRSGVKKMIDDRIGEVIDGAPKELDTLKEIATELEKNQSGVSTILNKMNSKLEAKDLTGYAKTSYVDDKVSKIDLSGYVKTSEIKPKVLDVQYYDYEKKVYRMYRGYIEEVLRNMLDDIGSFTHAMSKVLDDKASEEDIKTKLSEMTEDSTHRTVTDEEKKKWNSVKELTIQEVEVICNEILK